MSQPPWKPPFLTIITPTTGNPLLLPCIQSVQDSLNLGPGQVRHLLVVDGSERLAPVIGLGVDAASRDGRVPVDRMVLPYVTGHEQFNGHRIYAATSFLVNSAFVMWLDEDNRVDPSHIDSLVNLVSDHDLTWAHSLRTIHDHDGRFICRDDCESLGNVKNVCGDYLIDTSCFILSTQLAWQLAPLWHRRARQPDTVPADRIITRTLLQLATAGSQRGGSTGRYTLQYRLGSRSDSVQADFFLAGNARFQPEKTWSIPQIYPSKPSPPASPPGGAAIGQQDQA